MKKLIIFIAIFLFADDTKEILKLINILNHKSFSYIEVNNIYNPFVDKPKVQPIKMKIKTKAEKINTNYTLEVVFQHKVKINGNWYKNGDTIDGYKIILIGYKVFLKKHSKTILLNRKTILKVR